jgi:hypothetical protein
MTDKEIEITDKEKDTAETGKKPIDDSEEELTEAELDQVAGGGNHTPDVSQLRRCRRREPLSAAAGSPALPAEFRAKPKPFPAFGRVSSFHALPFTLYTSNPASRTQRRMS